MSQSRSKDKNREGIVYLIGAGPGDLQAITIKGMKSLQICDVVVYDRLVSSALLQYVPKQAERIFVGKRAGSHPMKQEAINRILVEQAKMGRKVARLKGGDPFVFGRGGEEILALQAAGIPYQVISGVSSAIAVPASAGIPVTHRRIGQSFHVVTGHTADGVLQLTDDYETLAKLQGTLIFLMGVMHIGQITQQLIRYGKDNNTPAAVIEQGMTLKQRIIRAPLGKLADKAEEAGIKPPAVIVVGHTADLHFAEETGTLVCRVGVTGTEGLVSKLSDKLLQFGIWANPFPYVMIRNNQEEKEQLKDILKNFKNQPYDWIVFTSSNGVRCFMQCYKEAGLDIRMLADTKLAAVGPGTGQALSEYGLYPDYIPEQYTTEALARGLTEKLPQNGKVLLPRARWGSKEINEIFDKNRISYTEIALYDTFYQEEIRRETLEAVPYLDILTFASASGVKGLLADMTENQVRKLFSQCRIVCIGEATARALREYGMKQYYLAEACTVDGISDTVWQLINE